MPASEHLKDILRHSGTGHAALVLRLLEASDVAEPRLLSCDVPMPPVSRATQLPWWRHPWLRPMAPIGRPLLQVARHLRVRARRH